MINESKNFNTGSISAGGDVSIGDHLYKSIEYKEINQKIEDLEALVEATSDDKKKQDYLERLNKEKKLLEEFKTEIKSLAKTFSEIQLNTERLKIAKAHFDSGEYKEARAVMNAQEVLNEFEQLLNKKEELEKDVEVNNTALIDKSSEFLILAELATLDFNNENRYDDAEIYYQKSLEAYRYEKNISGYASFLYSQNKFEFAKNLYEELIERYKELTNENREFYLIFLVNTYLSFSKTILLTGSLNEAREKLILALKECDNYNFEDDNLLLAVKSVAYQSVAGIDVIEKKYSKAAINYEKALAIERDLQNFDKEHNRLFSIILLNKLVIFYIKIKQLNKVREYLNEALQLFDTIIKEKKITIEGYLPGLADLHTNYGVYHAMTQDFSISQTSFEEAIRIYRKMLNINRHGYLPSLAGVLLKFVKNLPNNQVDKREAACIEAIEIYESLHESNESNYNLSIAYIQLAKIELINKGKAEKANDLFDKVVNLRRALSKNGDDFYKKFFLDTLVEIGTIKLQLSEHDISEKYFLEALEVCSELSLKDYNTYEFYSGRIHNNIGSLYFNAKRLDDAEIYISGAMVIFEELTEKGIFSNENENPKVFYARILSNKADVKVAKNELLKALKLYDQSAMLYRDLSEANPECFYDLAEILTLIAFTLEKMNEFDAAKLEIEEALHIYDALKEFDPEALNAYNKLIKIKARLNVA